MKKYIMLVAAAAAMAAMAEDERGFKFFGERLTLRPYVSLSYTYDSNVHSVHDRQSGSTWVVNPGFSLDYKGDNWSIDGRVYYQYHAYNRDVHQLNTSSYGETLSFKWRNAPVTEKGFDLILSETFQQIAQDDDATEHGGRGYGRDRMSATFSGVLERRFNEHLHADVYGDYYFLDFDNDVKKYGTLYGWDRWTLGASAGYMFSRWLDAVISASYYGYTQDNNKNLMQDVYDDETSKNRHYKHQSEGWSLMGGLSSRATERITYRTRVGWSHFEYADVYSQDGWTYQVDARWQLDDGNRWNMFLLGNSYYQPGERDYGTAHKVYTASWGIGHALLQNKLNVTFDLSYRCEDTVYSDSRSSNSTDHIYTARLGLSYRIRHYLSVYGRAEYQLMDSHDGGYWNDYYDYNRYRLTVGLRLTY